MASSDVQNVDIVLNQGRTSNFLFSFNNSLTGVAVDVTDWEFSCEVRDLYDSESVLATGLFSALGLNTNQTMLTFDDSVTASLPLLEGTNPGYFRTNKFTYDVVATIDGEPYSVQRGTVYFNPTVTEVV